MVTSQAKRKDEETATEATEASEYEDGATLKRKGVLRLISIIPLVIAIIVFILTEDMRNPMVFVGPGTIWMAVIAAVQVVLALFCKKSYKEEKQEEATA